MRETPTLDKQLHSGGKDNRTTRGTDVLMIEVLKENGWLFWLAYCAVAGSLIVIAIMFIEGIRFVWRKTHRDNTRT